MQREEWYYHVVSLTASEANCDVTYVQELVAVHTGHETVHGHSVMVIVVGVDTAQVLPP